MSGYVKTAPHTNFDKIYMAKDDNMGVHLFYNQSLTTFNHFVY
jgi:hypothetical protein